MAAEQSFADLQGKVETLRTSFPAGSPVQGDFGAQGRKLKKGR